jgi:hypothetical protein
VQADDLPTVLLPQASELDLHCISRVQIKICVTADGETAIVAPVV